jgi:hypothetical protein
MKKLGIACILCLCTASSAAAQLKQYVTVTAGPALQTVRGNTFTYQVLADWSVVTKKGFRWGIVTGYQSDFYYEGLSWAATPRLGVSGVPLRFVAGQTWLSDKASVMFGTEVGVLFARVWEPRYVPPPSPPGISDLVIISDRLAGNYTLAFHLGARIRLTKRTDFTFTLRPQYNGPLYASRTDAFGFLMLGLNAGVGFKLGALPKAAK